MVLGTVWDTPEDALEFSRALAAREGAAWRTGGDRVALVFGPAGEARDRVLRSLAP